MSYLPDFLPTIPGYYALYNRTVYDCTVFYQTVMPSATVPPIPPPGAPNPPTATDVSDYNTRADVEAAIVQLSSTLPNALGTEQNIFDICDAVRTNQYTSGNPWGVSFESNYSETVQKTITQIRTEVNTNSRYIVRVNDHFIDIQYMMVNNQYLLNFPISTTTTNTPNGTPVTPIALFDIFLTKDYQTNTDLVSLYQQIMTDYNAQNHRVRIHALSQNLVNIGSPISSLNFSNRDAFAVTISGDGTTLALARRISATDAAIDVYRYMNNKWSVIQTNIMFLGIVANTEVPGLDTLIGFSPSRTFDETLIQLSANGQVLAIGNRTATDNSGPVVLSCGSVTVYEYNGNMFVPKGNVIYGDTLFKRLGYDIALSGDGNTIVAGYRDIAVSNRQGAEVYRYNDLTSMWDLDGDLDASTVATMDIYGPRTTVSFNGQTAAIGENNQIRLYLRTAAAPNAYTLAPNGTLTVLGTSEFGRSLQISHVGELFAIGAKNSTSGFGEVYVYNRIGTIWQQLGNTIRSFEPNYGLVISASITSLTITIGGPDLPLRDPPSSSTDNISLNGLGGVEYFRYDSPTQFWFPQTRTIGSSVYNGGNTGYISQLTYPGDRFILGAPNEPSASVQSLNATVRNFDNSYAVIVRAIGNFITDRDVAGLDNDPSGQTLSMINGEIDSTPYGSLVASTNPNYDRQLTKNGNLLYIADDGSFLYDSFVGVAETYSYRLGGSATASTISFILDTSGSTIIATAPLPVIVKKNLNGGANYFLENNIGTVNVTYISPGFSFALQGGTFNAGTNEWELTLPASRGTYYLNNDTGNFRYEPDPTYNTLGLSTDLVNIDISEVGTPGPTTATLVTAVQTMILSDMILNPVLTVFVTTNANSNNPGGAGIANGIGFLTVTNGQPPFIYDIVGPATPGPGPYDIELTIAFGTVRLNTVTGEYLYTPVTAPSSPGGAAESFMVRVTDLSGDISTTSFNTSYIVNPDLTTPPLPGVTIQTAAGSILPPIVSNASGTLMASGGSSVYNYEFSTASVAGPGPNQVQQIQTEYTAIINTINGLYSIVPGTIPSTVGNYLFVTVFRAVDGIQGDFEDANLSVDINVLPALTLATPTSGQVIRAVNDTIPPTTSGLSGTLSPSGGVGTYTYNISGVTTSPFPNFVQQMMMYGTLLLNTINGAYIYTTVTPPNIQGSFNDDFTVQTFDAQGNESTALYRVTYNVSAEFTVTTPINGSVIRQANNPNITQISLAGTLAPTGGQMPYSFAINGSNVGTYGTLTLNTTNGAYSYGNLNIPNNVLTDTDVFTIDITDNSGRVISTTYTVNITVTAGIVLPTPPEGSIIKSVNGTNINETGLTGTLMPVGAGPPFQFGIQGVPTAIIGPNQIGFGQHGRLQVTIATGAYIYIRNPTTLDTVDRVTDSFIFTLLDGSGATASAPYRVTITVNPELLIERPTPSVGSITRNINETGFKATGLSGTYVPSGGLPPYTFSIQGGMDTGAFFEQTMPLGKLRVNKTTGFYEFIDPNIPNTPGETRNIFIIQITDSNGEIQLLDYAVQITVKSIPLALLPVFTDVQNRSSIRYWNFVIHTGLEPDILSFENTEMLVIGQTDPNPIPERNIDAILRQLLLAAIETTEIGNGGEDVITNIRNNTKDILETDDRSGVLTYSLRFQGETGSGKIERIIELADILSTSHKNFLLNRYRSNIGEGLLVFYYDDAPQSIIDKILTQIEILNSLGVGGVILVIVATDTTKDPAGTRAVDVAYANSLGAKQTEIINKITAIRSRVNISSCSIRYNPSSNRYQNVGVKTVVESGQPRVPEQLQYSIPTTLPTRTLFDAISSLPQFIKDSAFPRSDLRVVITEVNQNMDQATGIVLYSRINSLATEVTFISSRPLPPTQTANRVLRAHVEFLPVEQNQPQEILISSTPGSTARPRDLRPGDVLYNEAYRFTQPNRVVLLISTVSGVNNQNVIGAPIFLQIDDSVRFPNNPVFVGEIVNIVQKFDSNTLESLPPGTSIEFGFDYQLIVQLPTASGQTDTFSAAPLEEYTRFPRLGFVTIYDGRSSEDGSGIRPYARGSVLNLTR